MLGSKIASLGAHAFYRQRHFSVLFIGSGILLCFLSAAASFYAFCQQQHFSVLFIGSGISVYTASGVHSPFLRGVCLRGWCSM
jgi:hypothetical protein